MEITRFLTVIKIMEIFYLLFTALKHQLLYINLKTDTHIHYGIVLKNPPVKIKL